MPELFKEVEIVVNCDDDYEAAMEALNNGRLALVPWAGMIWLPRKIAGKVPTELLHSPCGDQFLTKVYYGKKVQVLRAGSVDSFLPRIKRRLRRRGVIAVSVEL